MKFLLSWPTPETYAPPMRLGVESLIAELTYMQSLSESVLSVPVGSDSQKWVFSLVESMRKSGVRTTLLVAANFISNHLLDRCEQLHVDGLVILEDTLDPSAALTVGHHSISAAIPIRVWIEEAIGAESQRLAQRWRHHVSSFHSAALTPFPGARVIENSTAETLSVSQLLLCSWAHAWITVSSLGEVLPCPVNRPPNAPHVTAASTSAIVGARQLLLESSGNTSMCRACGLTARFPNQVFAGDLQNQSVALGSTERRYFDHLGESVEDMTETRKQSALKGFCQRIQKSASTPALRSQSDFKE